MKFDKKITKMYTDRESYLIHELGTLFRDIPEKYRLLFGLRASVLKWQLICEGKNVQKIFESCGLCFAQYGMCIACPLKYVYDSGCVMIPGEPTKEEARKVHKILYDLYMKEHRRFEK